MDFGGEDTAEKKGQRHLQENYRDREMVEERLFTCKRRDAAHQQLACSSSPTRMPSIIYTSIVKHDSYLLSHFTVNSYSSVCAKCCATSCVYIYMYVHLYAYILYSLIRYHNYSL